MYLDEFFDYKNQLMKDICCDEEIAKLITNNKGKDVPNHKLAYTQVFPYEFVPDTINDAQTIICFDVDIADVENKTFYLPVLYIWVFTHASLLRLPEGGVRIDQLSSEIDKVLNGSRFYGLGELELKSVGRFSPIQDYYGRVLTYKARDFNRSGSKPPAANRKRPRVK